MSREAHDSETLRRWRVRFYRWGVYEIRDVEAPSEVSAEQRGIEMYEGGTECTEIDGGTEAPYAEEEEE